MSPSKSPSPDRQHTLYSVHLQGMERPVRSFKSFIRVTPRVPDKPLPPVPAKPSLHKNTSSSSITTVQSRSTGWSLWEAPSNWDNGEGSQAQSTTSFGLRQYSPLIPEPPEDVAAMQADPTLWQQSNGSFQQTPLGPICERTAATPDIPPRNPSRLSLSLVIPASTARNSKVSVPSVTSRYSTNTNDDGPSGERFDGSKLPSPLDLFSALSDMTMKETTSGSLSSPRDQGIIWGGQHEYSDSEQFEVEPHLGLQGNKLKTVRNGSMLADDNSANMESPELSERTPVVSFAQDHHNVLADRSLDDQEDLALSKKPQTEQDLTPQPLAWNKPLGASTAEPPHRPRLAPVTSSGRYKNIRKMSSWVNHRFRKESQLNIVPRSISDPGFQPHVQVPESEADRNLRYDARLVNLVQHGKDLLSRRILRHKSEPMAISPPHLQRFEPTPHEPLLVTAPFEMATPLFRLPGGLAVVRQSPLSTPRPQTAGESPSSPLSDLSWPDFPVSSPFRRDFSRCGSCQSVTSLQESTSPYADIRHKFSSPMGSPLVLRSFSYSTTSLTTRQSQDDLSSPYNLPQLRRRSHNVGSPLTAPPSPCLYVAEQQTEETVESMASKLSLFEKARNAREAWKKQQKDAKNEKFKQSIRLVGPADARDVVGYIRCAVDGRQSGDSGIGEDSSIGEGKLPAQVLKEVS